MANGAQAGSSGDGGGSGGSGGSETKVSCDGDAFGEEFARYVIGTLAQPAWEGRRFDSKGLENTEIWVKAMFECVGLKPGAGGLPGLPTDAFEHPFETSADDTGEIPPDMLEGPYKFTNVIAHVPGSGALAGEYIVVGAHMDHLGNTEEGLIVGADDDASGILALLALSKKLAASPPGGDRRTVVFAAWGIEEDPFYRRGSAAFLDEIEKADPAGKDKIMYYINFDMIGGYKHDKDGTPQVYALGTYSGSVARGILDEIGPSYPTIDTSLGSLGASSDQVSFCLQKIPYVFFWTNDKNYHSPDDTVENIDFEHIGPILGEASELLGRLAIEPDLATNKAAFDPDGLAEQLGGQDCEFAN